MPILPTLYGCSGTRKFRSSPSVRIFLLSSLWTPSSALSWSPFLFPRFLSPVTIFAILFFRVCQDRERERGGLVDDLFTAQSAMERERGRACVLVCEVSLPALYLAPSKPSPFFVTSPGITKERETPPVRQSSIERGEKLETAKKKTRLSPAIIVACR